MPSPLITIAAAVLLGVLGQIVASATRLPAIVFLLLLGVISGRHCLHLIEPQALGAGLPVLVSAFIAVILFEGALTLRPHLLQEALALTRRLITIGAVITLCATALLARLLVGLPWSLAFLFGSLVIVTGPTVIAPILRRVRLSPRLHAVIKSESILIDPVGVFVTVAVFQYVVGLADVQTDWQQTVLGFLARMGSGVAVGGGVGAATALFARLPFFHRHDNEHLICLGALGLALATFAVAEHLQSESGVMAVIALGLVLAAVPIPFRDELEKFKDKVTILGVSVLFIVLSANLNVPLLLRAGIGEMGLLLGLIFLVRPAAVFLSTWGTNLDWREKTYLSMIAPRGILAAAMSSYFAAELRSRGLPGANRIELLVFLTIAVTVCLQGGWSGLLARFLRVEPHAPNGFVLVGINSWSLAVAEQLVRCGRSVVFIDRNSTSCDDARKLGFVALELDATEANTYQAVSASAGTVIAMTSNDAINTLACEAATHWFSMDNIYQIIAQPVVLGDRRSKVRMAGKWAMPTMWSFREITEMLRTNQMQTRRIRYQQAGVIQTGGDNSEDRAIPLLLVVDAKRVRIAVNGEHCVGGAEIIAMVPVLNT